LLVIIHGGYKGRVQRFIYLSSLTAGAQGIQLVVRFEEEVETLDEEIGAAIFVNPKCDSSHSYIS